MHLGLSCNWLPCCWRTVSSYFYLFIYFPCARSSISTGVIVHIVCVSVGYSQCCYADWLEPHRDGLTVTLLGLWTAAAWIWTHGNCLGKTICKFFSLPLGKTFQTLGRSFFSPPLRSVIVNRAAVQTEWSHREHVGQQYRLCTVSAGEQLALRSLVFFLSFFLKIYQDRGLIELVFLHFKIETLCHCHPPPPWLKVFFIVLKEPKANWPSLQKRPII